MTQYYGGGGGRGFPFHYLIAAIIAIAGGVMYMTRTTINPNTGEKQHVSLTPEQEIQLGQQAHNFLTKGFLILHQLRQATQMRADMFFDPAAPD